ncbi:MAG: glutamine synthetase III [Bacillales bacterium]|nr:glutamine synthetase III [Bacillales bacterium]
MKIGQTEFGCKVFDKETMKKKLPSPIFTKYELARNHINGLDRDTADVIAHAMKEWAIEHGCTHFTHWFQPLTSSSAHKHDSFIDNKDGETILKFSGKNLIKGEPDASSFPSGGLRATFEARGYTYWDVTSYAFIRDNILYIPTIFVSYNGDSLDHKEPLLKSMDVLSSEATKIVNLFGDKSCTSVKPYIGLEQEYFLIDKDDYQKRIDIRLSGTTLIGAIPPKSQQLRDHYFGDIPTRVEAFMKDVDNQLWELGIQAKSEHNEVAPGQFELACIYKDANIAVDQNIIVMDVLKRVALKHNMVCLLAEKPFKGINGSGKHNNYSLITNTGTNLFDPGKNPHENIQFLIFVCALISAVDKYGELLRLTSSNPGNDYRLGADEAPPAIVSIYLGDVIESVLDSIVSSSPTNYRKSNLKDFSISTLSYLPHDNSDRNRTSPIAFTGNKFEFRMLASSANASNLTLTINTILANELRIIASRLLENKYRQDIRKDALSICAEIINKHHRILFSGDGYSASWVKEAKKRGLSNIKTFYEAIEYFLKDESIELFSSNGVFTKEEIQSRGYIFYEDYVSKKTIEAKTLIDMIRSYCTPCVRKEIYDLNKTNLSCDQEIINKLTEYVSKSNELCANIEHQLFKVDEIEDIKEKGKYILDNIVPLMVELRKYYDDIEKYISHENLIYPTYRELFFDVE